MPQGAAAIVQGMRDLDPPLRVAGVLLNRVGSAGHARMVTEAIESAVGVPVVGYLGREDALHLPERHLGLIPTLEPGDWRAWIEAARTSISATVNVDQVLELARSARPLPITQDDPFKTLSNERVATIAVARDAAFNFIYPDNLDLLRAARAEIVFFSPMTDTRLPAGTQAMYICGGFPEIYASELAANVETRGEIRAAFQADLPIYAECGGFMYLTRELVGQANNSHAMVGILPGRSVMMGHLTSGYRTIRARDDNWLWRAGETGRGHEFHYSRWEHLSEGWSPAYELWPGEFQHHMHVEGAQRGTLLASYVHLHLLTLPELAARFVRAAADARPWGQN